MTRGLLAFAFLVFGTSAFGQASGAAAQAALVKQIVGAEQAWASAFQSCRPEALDSLTTDDFSFTDYNGMTYSRTWFMKTAKQCERTVVRIEPMQVTINDNDGAAIVLSRYHQFFKDQAQPVHHLTHVLVKQDGAWRVALHHSTVMLTNAGPPTGKAFAQLAGGPSTRTAPAFEPLVARMVNDPAKNVAVDRVAMEKQAVDTALTYVSLFQNCRTADLDKVMSRDYLISGYNGMTYTRKWMVEGSDGCSHDVQRIEPLQLRLYGNTAILLGRYHQFLNNQPLDFRHVTVVVFREESVWRVALHHSTTLNEKLGSAEGKLFYSEGGNSTLVTLPFPNRVTPRPPQPPAPSRTNQ